MIYITKGQENDLILNINNNSTSNYSEYKLEFTHVLSQEIKNYTIDTTDPAQYSSTDRYCDLILPLDVDDLNYLGQYQLRIFGDSTDLVYTGMVILEGTTEPSNDYIEYASPNEDNTNYIYIT